MIVLKVTETNFDRYSEKGVVVCDYETVPDKELILGIDLIHKDLFPELEEVEVEYPKLPWE